MSEVEYMVGDRVIVTCYESIKPIGRIWDMDMRGNPQGTIQRYHVKLDEPLHSRYAMFGIKPVEWQYVTAKHLELC